MWTPAYVVLLTLVVAGEGAKILGLFPLPVKSHMAVNLALVKELARRGHEVTVYSPFPEEEVIPNYTNHVLNITLESLKERSGSETMEMRQTNPVSMVKLFLNMAAQLCEMTMEDTAIQKLLSSSQHYDLLIMEIFVTQFIIGFAHKFKTPIIKICAFGGSHWIGDPYGNPNPYAYVPDVFFGFSDKMNFWERVQNTIFGTAARFVRYFYHLPRQEYYVKKYFSQFKDMPSVYELETSASLLLMNGHFSISYPAPLMPNMIQVGGMHIKPPQRLPEDIQEFLDSAKNGAIYFSMGSNLKSVKFPEERKSILVHVFSNLKQKVLWKFEDELSFQQSSNLKLGKWLPQSDILAHPNVKAFITHGGLLSCQEAIVREVPIIGIPMYGDQYLNVRKAVEAGYGLHLEYENITVSSLSWALNEVLHNPRYQQNIKRISRLFHDQPLSPLDTAVYWTEYVLRHNGTSHMRSAAVDLHWYQYFLLDVIAFLVLSVTALLLIGFLVLRGLCRRRDLKPATQHTKKDK